MKKNWALKCDFFNENYLSLSFQKVKYYFVSVAVFNPINVYKPVYMCIYVVISVFLFKDFTNEKGFLHLIWIIYKGLK